MRLFEVLKNVLIVLLCLAGSGVQAEQAEGADGASRWFHVNLLDGSVKAAESGTLDSITSWMPPAKEVRPNDEPVSATSGDPVHPSLRLLADFDECGTGSSGEGGGECSAISVCARLTSQKSCDMSRSLDDRVKELQEILGVEVLQGNSEVKAVFPEIGAAILSVTHADLDGLIQFIDEAEYDAQKFVIEPAYASTLRQERAEKASCKRGNGDDIQDGRALIRSSRLASGLAPSGSIALLDTGCYAHTFLKSSYGKLFDCVAGNAAGNPCVSSSDGVCRDGFEDRHEYSHGTKSAGILSSRDPKHYQGVTNFEINSYQITENDKVKYAVRGLRAAISNKEEVILVESQNAGFPNGCLSAMADCAFDHGAVVIAPIGNKNGFKRISSPANGHKVLGVGAVSISSPANPLGRRRGAGR